MCVLVRFNSFAGFGRLSRLSNLQVLDLSGNDFSNNVLPSLSGLTSPKSLNLASNNLRSSIRIQGKFFCNFSQGCSKPNNSLWRSCKLIPLHWICADISDLNSLKELDLSNNKIRSSVLIPGMIQTWSIL